MDCPGSASVLSVAAPMPAYCPQMLHVQNYQQPLDYASHVSKLQLEEEEEVLDLCVKRKTDSPPPAMPPLASPTPPLSPLLATFPPILSSHNKSAKPTRPFKAYPKDPLSMVAGVAATETLLGHGSSDAYLEFRRRMLEQLQASGVSGKMPGAGRMPSSPQQQPSSSDSGLSSENGSKNAAYWERRRKNNEAAKRSRDARRAKEDELAIRAAFLEQENLKLKYEVTALRTETSKLRYLLFNGNR